MCHNVREPIRLLFIPATHVPVIESIGYLPLFKAIKETNLVQTLLLSMQLHDLHLLIHKNQLLTQWKGCALFSLFKDGYNPVLLSSNYFDQHKEDLEKFQAKLDLHERSLTVDELLRYTQVRYDHDTRTALIIEPDETSRVYESNVDGYNEWVYAIYHQLGQNLSWDDAKELMLLKEMLIAKTDSIFESMCLSNSSTISK